MKKANIVGKWVYSELGEKYDKEPFHSKEDAIRHAEDNESIDFSVGQVRVAGDIISKYVDIDILDDLILSILDSAEEDCCFSYNELPVMNTEHGERLMYSVRNALRNFFSSSGIDNNIYRVENEESIQRDYDSDEDDDDDEEAPNVYRKPIKPKAISEIWG